MTWSLAATILEWLGYWLLCSCFIVLLMNLGRMRRWLWARIRRPLLLREPLDDVHGDVAELHPSLRARD